jgi:hypothetical protein
MIQQRDADYKVRVQERGGHTHYTFYSKYVGQDTWACIGGLCVANDETAAFNACIAGRFMTETFNDEQVREQGEEK